MMHELPSALDALAANGVVDFDSEAYVYGKKPRYVGSPYEVNLPFEEPLPAFPKHLPAGTGMHAQPEHDEFKTKDVQKEHDGAPAWKKWLAAGLAIAGIAILGTKFKSKIKPTFKKISSLVAKPFKYIKNKFTKTAGAATSSSGSAAATAGASGTTAAAAGSSVAASASP